jgi:hypothetical protein
MCADSIYPVALRFGGLVGRSRPKPPSFASISGAGLNARSAVRAGGVKLEDTGRYV